MILDHDRVLQVEGKDPEVLQGLAVVDLPVITDPVVADIEGSTHVLDQKKGNIDHVPVLVIGNEGLDRAIEIDDVHVQDLLKDVHLVQVTEGVDRTLDRDLVRGIHDVVDPLHRILRDVDINLLLSILNKELFTRRRFDRSYNVSVLEVLILILYFQHSFCYWNVLSRKCILAYFL